MIKNIELYRNIQSWTQHKLTKRKQKQIAVRKKQKKKSQIREWIEALLWAVIVVFLINQFVFQLYQIPTPSMEDTLLVKDRVFVNKFIYGPELYPGGPKILSFNQPQRNEIIVLENPNYISRGPFFDVATRIIYMLTFSMINLDKDANGEDRAQLYVKRAIGMPGDTISFEKGNVFIQPAGYSEKTSEELFRQGAEYNFPMKRQFPVEDYDAFSAIGELAAYEKMNVRVPDYIVKLPLQNRYNFVDNYQVQKEYYGMLKKIDPSNSRYQSLEARYKNGFYIPENYVLPFGDNRDNSFDGRYFGPIAFKDVLGKTIFKFWPLHRFGRAE